jgi:hypothetical protein
MSMFSGTYPETLKSNWKLYIASRNFPSIPKLSRVSRDFPEYPKTFQSIRMLKKYIYRNFPKNLETFQTFRNISSLSKRPAKTFRIRKNFPGNQVTQLPRFFCL